MSALSRVPGHRPAELSVFLAILRPSERKGTRRLAPPFTILRLSPIGLLTCSCSAIRTFKMLSPVAYRPVPAAFPSSLSGGRPGQFNRRPEENAYRGALRFVLLTEYHSGDRLKEG
jgi:hypothetical protein